MCIRDRPYRVVTAHRGRHALCSLTKRRVAGQMAAGIVDLFEAVEVRQQHGKRLALPAAARQFIVQDLQNRRPIVQPGKRIVSGLDPQRFARFQQRFLQIENPPSGAQPYPQFVVAERLGEVIVGARIHALHQVLRVGPRGQQHDVNVRLASRAAHPAADLHSVQPRHHPIQNRQPRRVLRLQDLPGFLPVARRYGLISPFPQNVAQHRQENRVVFGYQDPQPRTPRFLRTRRGFGERVQFCCDSSGLVHNLLIGRHPGFLNPAPSNGRWQHHGRN